MADCGSKAQVFHGTKSMVCGSRAKKSALKRLKSGKIVYKSRSKQATKKSGPLAQWRGAVSKAKTKLKIPKKSFILLKKGSGSTQGHKLYREAQKIYKK